MQRTRRHVPPAPRRNHLGRRFKPGAQGRVHRHRLKPQNRALLQSQTHFRGHLGQGFCDHGLHARQPIGAAIAPLHGKPHLPRHDRGCVRGHHHMANRPDRLRRDHIAQPVIQPGVKGRQPLKRIPAQRHRRGACVVLLTAERHHHLAVAHDVGHHPNLLTRCIQGRALFDVQLDEPGKAGRVHIRSNPVAQNLPRLGKRHPVGVGNRIGLGQTHHLGPDRRAGGAAKAALFVLKGHHRNRRPSGGAGRAGHFQRRDHPQGPIQPTARGLGVGMRPQQKRLPLGQPKEISHRVKLHAQPRIFHPRGQPIAGHNVRRREGWAHHAGACRAKAAQLVQVGKKAASIDHGASFRGQKGNLKRGTRL